MPKRRATKRKIWELAVASVLASGSLTSATTYQWSAAPTTPASGGTGTWDLAGARWLGTSGYVAWPNTGSDAASFGGTAGTVTLGADGISAGELDFTTDGYTLAAGGHTLNGNLTINVAPGLSATVSAPLSGSILVNNSGTLSLTGGGFGGGQFTQTRGVMTLSGPNWDFKAGGKALGIGTHSSAASATISGTTVNLSSGNTGNLNDAPYASVNGPSGTSLLLTANAGLTGMRSMNVGTDVLDQGSLTVEGGSHITTYLFGGVINGNLSVGSSYQSVGSLLVRTGGQITANDTSVGFDTTSSGSVTVTGAGSALSLHSLGIGGSLTSAGSGTGAPATVTVADGAVATIGTSVQFWNNNDTLTINGATLKTMGLNSSGAAGTINLTDPVGDHALVFDLHLSAGGLFINSYAGSITGTGSVQMNSFMGQSFSGTNSYTGGTFVTGGGSLGFTGAGSMPAGGTISNDGTVNVTAANTAGAISGTGTLHVGNATLTAAHVSQGTLDVMANGVLKIQTPTPGTNQTSNLTINASGKLDLTNNSLAVNYGSAQDPVASIRTNLSTGFNHGTWDGFGIMSSSAAAAGATLGYADSADGVVVGLAANTVLVKYTIAGDVNLDGAVDLADYTAVVRNFGKANASWDQGDFFYDGTVGLDDYTAVVRNYGKNVSSVMAAGADAAPTPVPEPAGLAPTLIGLLTFVTRRRRVRA